ncbi:MAG: putative bifunctional diguanylate cyclase/phosphodiesterase [Rhizobiaceae bacterium]
MLIATLVASTAAALWNIPRVFGWEDADALNWLASVQVAMPAVAAACAMVAAYVSSARDRAAWMLISAGGLVYVGANVAYVALAKEGAPFPTPADGAFFIMALLFGLGIMIYGQRERSSPVVSTYNFILLYGATILGTLFLLHQRIKGSVIGEAATVVAFLYPALWCSVAALGLVLLVIYRHGPRLLPFSILVVAMALEGTGDFIYASQLMDGTFANGGWPHLLWMMSASLVAWAAVEHALVARAGNELLAAPAKSPVALGEALAPAAILFVILITGSITGAFGTGLYRIFAASLAIILAITVGLRENWIVSARDRLQKIADERLHRLIGSERRLTSVLDTTSDSVIVLDSDWNIRFFNDQAVDLVPELIEVGIGGKFWSLLRPQEREIYGARFEEVLRTGQPLEIDTFNEQRQFWVELRAYATGEGLSLFFRNVTEQRRIRDELERLAHFDFLTGLHNRAVFTQRLQGMDPKAFAAVLLVDLDSFKEINDTLGHTVGDTVLASVATRLREVVPDGYLVARIGGDEFAVIAENSTLPEVAALGQRISAALSRPFVVDGEVLSFGASIGIASTDSTAAGLELFTKADIALYEAKASSNGEAVVFRPAMEARMRDRKELLADLSSAVEKGELELDYQPLLDIASQRTAGFEALVRWRHPVRGLVRPDEFIALAEESGLIVSIGEWVLRTACAEATSWPQGISVAVNLSTRQFSDHSLVDTIVQALMDSGLDHRRLELEITESALLHEANLPILKAIRDLGVRLALDDFGTGYSSLGYLQRVAFDKLKIDRSFIMDAPGNAKSKAIVEAVLEMARVLEISVTAEGVENAEQMQWISGRCHQAQGYFIAKPMPPREVSAYLSREVRHEIPRRMSAAGDAGGSR